MRIWIDATRRDEDVRVFGATLLERLLRSLVAAGLPARSLREVRVELGPGDPPPARLAPELVERLPLVFTASRGRPRDRLEEMLRDAGGEPVLALSADTLVDPRALAHAARAPGPLAFVAGVGEGRGALLRLDGPLPPDPTPAEDDAGLLAWAESALAAGAAAPFDPDAFSVTAGPRPGEPPWLLRVPGPRDAARAERFLFWWYEAPDDGVLARYPLSPLLWRGVRGLCERGTPPAALERGAALLGLAAAAGLAAGAWATALTLAWTGTALAALARRLGRVTLAPPSPSRPGALGGALPGIWAAGLALGLSGGDPGGLPFQAFCVLLVAIAGSRLATGEATPGAADAHAAAAPGPRLLRAPSAWRPASLLAVFSLALALGQAAAVFWAALAWQALGPLGLATRSLAGARAPSSRPSQVLR